ncbi:MAG: protein kinase [Myxococcales bacterium]|nr:protein kinase [Myxococcales bacterium]
MPDAEVDRGAWIGRVIAGRYRVVELLGEGGMGAVYAAEHLTLRKQVAVKTIRAEFAANSQADQRFAREALATGSLDHPHVASAIDYGHLEDGGAYLVTQLVRGESLAKRLRRGPLAWQEACELAAQVADALAAAHAAGIVHRDLKPDNILLERRHDGSLHAKVVDFGIARVSGAHGGAVGDASQPITRMGAVIGTPGYMAPEQATGGKIDERVDLYALGVIVWECCAGQPLWDPESVSEGLIGQLTRAAPSLYPDLAPEPVAKLVTTLLARAPGDRPASALVVRDALRGLAAAPLATGPAAPTKPAPTKPAPTKPAPTRPAPPTGPNPDGAATVAATAGRSRPLVWLGLALGLAAALWLATLGEEPQATSGAPAEAPASKPPASKPPARRGELPARRELLAELPPEFVEHGRVLLLSTDRAMRAEAGRAIAGAEGGARARIPGYFHQIAAFEAAGACPEKLAILHEMEAADDLRVVWALRNLGELPNDGCRGKDCLGCLRDELARVTRRFEDAIVEAPE